MFRHNGPSVNVTRFLLGMRGWKYATSIFRQPGKLMLYLLRNDINEDKRRGK
jgi:hypothetical protein